MDDGTDRLGAIGPTGLDIGGLWDSMPSGGLGTAPATFTPILLPGNDDGIILDDEAGMPSLAAIMFARSW